MIFIPKWDEEHDNVYLTTEDNLGFKMGFGLGEAHQKLDRPALSYMKNPIDFNKLENKVKINFE